MLRRLCDFSGDGWSIDPIHQPGGGYGGTIIATLLLLLLLFAAPLFSRHIFSVPYLFPPYLSSFRFAENESRLFDADASIDTSTLYQTMSTAGS
jgi:hypothetical protein